MTTFRFEIRCHPRSIADLFSGSRGASEYQKTKIHLDDEDKYTPPLSTICRRSSSPPSTCRHGLSALTPTRRHPVSKSVIIFRTKPSGFIFYFNIQMSTRFTVSAVDGRAYATPLVDTISIRAIERRFCVKLVDSGVRQHQHMLKKDRNYPRSQLFYLSLT